MNVYVQKSYELQAMLKRSPRKRRFGITYRANQQANHLVGTDKDDGACGKHNSQVRRFSHRSPVWLQQVVANEEIIIVNGERDLQNMKAHTDK